MHEPDFKLIVTVVRKNLSRRVVRACRKAGAGGCTIFQGKGVGTYERDAILGLKIEPERDIVFCLVEDAIVDRVLSKVNAAARLDRQGNGIAFVINSNRIAGIAHLLNDL